MDRAGLTDESRQREPGLTIAETAEVDAREHDLAMSLRDAALDLARARQRPDGCGSPPRTSGMTQKAHENEHPSWIFTNARIRSSAGVRLHAADRADVAGDGCGRSSLLPATIVTFSGMAANAPPGSRRTR